jgi:hypothetical protein
VQNHKEHSWKWWGFQIISSLCLTSLCESNKYQPTCIKHIIHENNVLGISLIADYANGHTIETSIIFFYTEKQCCVLLGCSTFREHKIQQLKRMGVGSGSEEDVTHSGEKLSRDLRFYSITIEQSQ